MRSSHDPRDSVLFNGLFYQERKQLRLTEPGQPLHVFLLNASASM